VEIYLEEEHIQKKQPIEKQKSLSMGMGFITLVEQLATEIAHF